MATHNLAVIIKNPSDDGKFLLLVKQTPPPKFGDEEYDSYVDSDLWDLPSTQLSSLEGESQSRIVVEGEESCLEKLDLSKFDLNLALNQILQQVGFGRPSGVQWKLWKCVEEPEFGPGLPIKTVYISGVLGPEHGDLQGQCKWMSFQSCLNCLLEVKPCSDRVGSLVVIGLIDDSIRSSQSKIPHALNFQEYPPGVKVVPMGSRTAKPFSTTNLVIFAPESGSDGSTDSGFISQGDALIVDPGCRSQFHEELKEIVAALPGKLVVFVTHHHHDHVDDHWSLCRTPVLGGEEICIGGQRVKVIFAPGHTDGHMALLDVSTHSLIVGDHCVGQGSAVLDISSGGNMHDYFETTYKFLEISPHVLISMHGRLNMWPKHMLCAYLNIKCEASCGSSGSPRQVAKGMNMLLHIPHSKSNFTTSSESAISQDFSLETFNSSIVEFAAKDFSVQKFLTTCGIHFFSRWMWVYLTSHFPLKNPMLRTPAVLGAVAVGGFAVLYSIKHKLYSK
ncbi:metallo-hydrolase/oxidoreductase superfamily protein [Actinidia rufa]|uniref:Metallo-hydrolase/oxidoreductase superfamily protein n=1 Tax=Actinidia rufa TaxID=165716 RepID=A0A7J0GZ37_9ERIC|nr:metallo-hydrolase/oxidoreductase superfamily protein [Actinidia rufa]